jgi:hypothetical protein
MGLAIGWPRPPFLDADRCYLFRDGLHVATAVNAIAGDHRARGPPARSHRSRMVLVRTPSEFAKLG